MFAAKFKVKFFIVIAALFLLGYGVDAQIRLPKIIGSNMVLQRNQPVPIWGWTSPGKTVKVKFANQQKNAVADGSGYWKVMLPSMPASDQPQNMDISADTSQIKLTNILVGEVWLGSGQSNMEYLLRPVPNHAKPVKGVDSAALELSAHIPNIRLFKVEKKLSLPDVTTKLGWQEAGGSALSEFSSPAYYFAKYLYHTLHVPIGIIQSAWGGSRIEPWTPPNAYAALPVFKDADVNATLQLDNEKVGDYFKSMIQPLAPFALKGFIWYQGESNLASTNEPDMRYAYKMQALIQSWRAAWNNEKLSFYSVLLAPLSYTERKADKVTHTAENLPEFWEQQMASLKIPYTEVISVTDLTDHLTNIHPSYKWIVGRRLALVALAKNYDYKHVVYSGPRYQSMRVDGNRAILKFSFANGLKTSDGNPVNYFTIAGEDGKFVPAQATISNDQVILSSPEVTKPVNVRFGWTESANPNLVNSTGLPAIPFRSNPRIWNYHK